VRSDTRVSRRPAASGRFVLRIDPGLHAALRRAAAEAGLSLNDYCARRLASPGADAASLPGAAAAVARAGGLFGADLVGVAAFGSWARGEATSGSDVDVLVVLEATVPLTRQLYREWDGGPVDWSGRPIEPHFLHLPTPDRTGAGIWAEVALDGIVLFERGLRLSRCLAGVRGDIAAGRLVRRLVHGQPYWTEVA
jgi:predicted nucleotidyltransferase